ncbi:MAG: folate family ECF transporter S component [Firmicutes bacterium]|nr:folate family ECF transporter S component [Bacillota bacterium]
MLKKNLSIFADSLKTFSDSLNELKNVKSLTGLSMLLALDLVLNLTASIQITQSLRLSFSFIASALMGMLYGPTLAALSCSLVDILQLFIKPTGPYFPGFTLSAALTGIIFGLFLYKNQCSLKRIIISKTLINVLIHLLLNSVWITVLYGSAFWANLPGRIVKNLGMLPVEILILWLILPFISKVRKS